MEKKNLSVPIAIVVAGLLIAGAVYYGDRKSAPTPSVNNGGGAEDSVAVKTPGADKINPVDGKDHIFGSRDAEIIIVEFSDFECPFCGRVHPTLKQVVDEYDGKVAWVYRHFPLSQIHPRADAVAQASECVAELGGNDAFWSFADGIFEKTISMSDFSGVKEVTGVDQSAVQKCVDSGKYGPEVAKDTLDATNTGGRGTPHAVIISSKGTKLTLSGAQPITAWRQVIDQLLAE